MPLLVTFMQRCKNERSRKIKTRKAIYIPTGHFAYSPPELLTLIISSVLDKYTPDMGVVTMVNAFNSTNLIG